MVEYGAPDALVSNPSDSLTVTVTADTTTQTPTLTSPTSTSRQNTLQLTYSLPEVPTGGTVNVSFNNGTTTTTLTMGNSQSVNVAVNLASLISTSGVAATTAASLADGTYTVTLSYQDYLGNTASTAVATAVVIDTTAPVLTEINQIPAQTNTTDAVYHFSTSEACSVQASQPTASPVVSVSTVIDSPSTPGTNYTARLSGIQLGGTYSVNFQCQDAAGNTSNLLHVGPFTVIGMSGGVGVPVVTKKDVEKVEKTVVKNTPQPIENTVVNKITSHAAISFKSAPEDSCDAEPYLTKAIKLGAKNNQEDVKLLEEFLNTYENAGLVVDGIYSKEDFDAVIKWQEKHAEDVLKPWGIKK